MKNAIVRKRNWTFPLSLSDSILKVIIDCPWNSSNAEIYTQNQVVIDFTCNYDSNYDNIEVSDVTVVSENVDADSQDETGLFTFGLVQYMDSAFSDAADAGDQTPLGGTMYFQLTMATPVVGLDWVIRGTL